MRRPTLHVSIAASLLLVASYSPLVRAQSALPTPEADVLAARAEFRQASSLAAAQDWAEALRHYEAAYELFAHPTTLYDIGVCHEKLGHDAQAYRYTLWALRPGASDDRRLEPEIRTHAEAALQAFESRLAVIELESHGVPLRVEVDGQKTTLLQTETGNVLFVDPRASAEAPPVTFTGSARLILDPAPHQLTLGDGARRETHSITALAGSRTSLEWASLAVASAPPLPAVTQPAAMPRPVAPSAAPNHTLQHVAIGSLIVGGAGLIAGTVAGGVALSAKHHLDDACSSDGSCPPSESSTMARFDRATAISTVSFAVGLAATATGVTLLLLAPKQAPTFALRLAPTHAALLTRF